MNKNELAVILLVTLVPVILIASNVFFAYNTERGGSHSGYVTAVDQSGLVFHNYDVYFKTDLSSSQEDLYCVNRSNQQLADQLRNYVLTGEKVTISYSGNRAIGLGLCSLEEIREVNPVVSKEQNGKK